MLKRCALATLKNVKLLYYIIILHLTKKCLCNYLLKNLKKCKKVANCEKVFNKII